MRKYVLSAILSLGTLFTFAQSAEIDSLKQIISHGRSDTAVVRTLCLLASDYDYYHPDSGYLYASRALELAQHLDDKKGEVRAIVYMGISLSKTGNHLQAMDVLIKGLKICEETKNIRGTEDIYTSLADLYVEEKDLKKATEYNFMTLALATDSSDKDFRLFTIENIGATYADMGMLDSALYYLNIAYDGFKKNNDQRSIALTEVNLAETYFKLKKDSIALSYYRSALPFITREQVSEALCESTLYMAKIFQRAPQTDSALFYGKKSFAISQNHAFSSRSLAASDLLASVYDKKNQADSALRYLKISVSLKDSLFNDEKSKMLEKLTFGENIRQLELAAQKKDQEEHFIRTLQYLAIAIFIPIFFLFVMFLSRIRVKARVVEFLGILSLLLLFEFITDLVYPIVSDWTHENPIWEMSILVILAAFLEPLNNRLEHWIKGKLVHKPARGTIPDAIAHKAHP